MEALIKMRSKDRMHNEDFFANVEILVDAAIPVENLVPIEVRERNGNVDDDKIACNGTPSTGSQKKNNSHKDRRTDKEEGGESNGAGETNKKRKLPSFLNPKCSEENFMKDCQNTTEDLKMALIGEYRCNGRAKKGKYLDKKERKWKPARSENHIGAKNLDNYSTLLSASLNCGAIETGDE